MTEADIQTIVQEVMRRMFAENGSIADSNGQDTVHPSKLEQADTVTVTAVVTRNDIVNFARAGKKRLVVQHGGLVTPLARDLAAEQGIELVWASETKRANGRVNTHAVDQGTTHYTYPRPALQTSLACLLCNSCLPPAISDLALS